MRKPPDEAEAEGFGYSKVEVDNEIWPGFRRNPGVPGKQSLLGWKPQGRGGFFPIALSLVVQIHPVFLSPSLRALGKILSRRCLLQS